MTKRERIAYEVLSVGEWVRCKAAEPQPSGWLHYELPDGTTGLVPASKWRVAEPVKK